MISAVGPEEVRRAVRALRTGIGESQQRFSDRLNCTLATAVRYERSRAPRGRALVKLAQIAEHSDKKELQKLAAVFHNAFREEMGLTSAETPVEPRHARFKNPDRLHPLGNILEEILKDVASINHGGDRVPEIQAHIQTSEGITRVIRFTPPENQVVGKKRPPILAGALKKAAAERKSQ